MEPMEGMPQLQQQLHVLVLQLKADIQQNAAPAGKLSTGIKMQLNQEEQPYCLQMLAYVVHCYAPVCCTKSSPGHDHYPLVQSLRQQQQQTLLCFPDHQHQ
jgi:hypothetical protein